jgi:lipopolysaccharide biosynthesis regulator YciM
MNWDSTVVFLFVAVVVVMSIIVAVLVLRLRRRDRDRPGNPYIEGLTRLIEGDESAAFEYLQTAVRSGTAPADAYIRLGRMLRERGNPGKALQIHRGLTVKQDLTRSEKLALFVNIAEDYAALGRPDQAVSVLDGAVSRLGLRDGTVHRLLARESHRMGSYERAYGYLKELRKHGDIGEADLASYLAEAGAAMVRGGKDREARRLLQRALKHDPDCARAHMALGDIAEKAGDLEGAMSQWRTAARLSPALAPLALTHLERVTFQEGLFSEMKQVYEEILSARPDDEVATLALASFLRKQGRDEEAIRRLEAFVDAHPRSIGAVVLLASLYAVNDPSRLQSFLHSNIEHFVHRAGDEKHVEEEMLAMPWH